MYGTPCLIGLEVNIHDETFKSNDESITRGNRKFFKNFTSFLSPVIHFFFFFSVQSIRICTIHKLLYDLITSCSDVSSHYVLHNETDNLMKRQVRGEFQQTEIIAVRVIAGRVDCFNKTDLEFRLIPSSPSSNSILCERIISYGI